MSIFTVRSVMHFLCIFFIIILLSMATKSSSSSTPSPSPAPVILQLQEEEQINNNNYALIQEEVNKFKDVESQFQTEEEFQDYGFWSPAPYFDRGNPAPIPHLRGHNPKERKAK
ncbi:hypothetical protein P3S68_026697 [Capsicum galapagoense]